MADKNRDEDMTVELELDDRTVLCDIISIFTANGKDYIALLPRDGQNDEEESVVWIYGYSENPDDPNEEPELRYIEDEEEYEIASDAFDELLDEEEFEEM